jgi:hypothetical protein
VHRAAPARSRHDGPAAASRARRVRSSRRERSGRTDSRRLTHETVSVDHGRLSQQTRAPGHGRRGDRVRRRHQLCLALRRPGPSRSQRGCARPEPRRSTSGTASKAPPSTTPDWPTSTTCSPFGSRCDP